MAKIIDSNIVTAFSPSTIGTKVLEKTQDYFRALLSHAVDSFDFASQRIPGQGVVLVPNSTQCVSAGIGKRQADASAYLIRKHWTGKIKLFLKREHAAKPDSVSCVVDTRQAYLADPDVIGTPEAERILSSDCTHVLVAVLAKVGEGTPPLSPGTFVRNLAGANNEALAWTADEIRAKAKEISTYSEEWCAVADPEIPLKKVVCWFCYKEFLPGSNYRKDDDCPECEAEIAERVEEMTRKFPMDRTGVHE